jgi:transposase
MTDREELALTLRKLSGTAQGFSKATMIMGMSRDKFVKLMAEAAEEVGKTTVSTVPYASECPRCGNRVTFVTLNGVRMVKWDDDSRSN